MPVRSPTGLFPSDYDDGPGAKYRLLTNKVLRKISQAIQTALVPAQEALDLLGARIFGGRALPMGGLSSYIVDQMESSTFFDSVSWHPTNPLLAAVSSDCRSVDVFNFKDKIPHLGQNMSNANTQCLRPFRTLKHKLQDRVYTVAWRPSAGTVLAVGCKNGVCLWHINLKNHADSQLVWLQSPSQVNIHALCWHPRGRLLAGSSLDSPGFFVWDVATGEVTVLRRGSDRISLLRWSPCGSYLFTGTQELHLVDRNQNVTGNRNLQHQIVKNGNGAFRIWETMTWTSSVWAMKSSERKSRNRSHENDNAIDACAGRLVGAEWSPNSKSILIAYTNSLFTLHFTGETPSLSAQVLPAIVTDILSSESLRLQQVWKDNDGNMTPASIGDMIRGIAWDPSGQRLAVNLGSKHRANGYVALFDARCDPILTARLIGYINPCNASNTEIQRVEEDLDWEMVDEPVRNEAKLIGNLSTQMSFAYWPRFEQGALLSVHHDNIVASIPLYFSS